MYLKFASIFNGFVIQEQNGQQLLSMSPPPPRKKKCTFTWIVGGAWVRVKKRSPFFKSIFLWGFDVGVGKCLLTIQKKENKKQNRFGKSMECGGIFLVLWTCWFGIIINMLFLIIVRVTVDFVVLPIFFSKDDER